MSGNTNENKTEKVRQQYVVKANDLIRRTRYSLSAQQQKIILLCISKIRPEDTPNTEYEISIDELCQACNLKIDNGGYYYKAIKEDFIELTTRLWVRMPDATEQTVSWISDATFLRFSGTIRFTFHKAMVPYLFNLQSQYTQYHLEDVLLFRGKYAIRLYEILRSYTTQKAIEHGWKRECTIELEELRDILAVDGYPRWSDFERFVLRKAVDEINQCSDEMSISYEPVLGNGKSVSQIHFVIDVPKAQQRIDAYREKNRRLKNK